MSLIKSISGIRGTIGGVQGDALTPIDVVKFTSAYAAWVKKENAGVKQLKVVVGRDARISGEMVEGLVVSTLCACGIDVVNIGLASTPTTEIAVTAEKANGGIIITASHNPRQWNALKLLNSKGEFLNAEEGSFVLSTAESGDFDYVQITDEAKNIGSVTKKDYTDYHIDLVLNLPLVNAKAIAAKKYKVMLDPVNSVGGIIVPRLLERLGVECVTISGEPNGEFSHNPEPLEKNLQDIIGKMTSAAKSGKKYDAGFVVDPDVDRLAIIQDDGKMFGEEYTIVSVASYVLGKCGAGVSRNTVSNLSSSRALADVTRALGGEYNAAAVGEVNVVAKMKSSNAIIGGEGNGGVIYPECHYGRDAIVGIALYLSLMAETGKLPSELKPTYPQYVISKNRIDLSPAVDVDKILATMKQKYSNEKVTDIDGVKIDFADSWVHLRKSNTEPIIRIYAEASDEAKADALAEQIKEVINSLV